MTINSPRDALEHIVTLCNPAPATSPAPWNHDLIILRKIVTEAASAGLAQPDPAMGPPIPMPHWEANTVAEALTVMLLQARTLGRHYLPSAWVGAVCARALVLLQQSALTPVQAAADQLLTIALEHERCLEREAGHGDIADLAVLRALLNPLRPAPNPPEYDELVLALVEVTAAARRAGFDKMIAGAEAVLKRVPK